MTVVPPARRFLHLCWCCVDAPPVVELLVAGLGMRNTMSSPMERWDGAVLGLTGEAESSADFVYDARGPRQSPAVEVQQWNDPPIVGEPATDPTAFGMQALGIAVADLDAAVVGLVERGCSVVGRGTSPFVDPATPAEWATLAGPKGFRIDLVADAEVPEGESRMRHLRVAVTDLERSLPWYAGVGFETLERTTIHTAAVLGHDGDVDVDVARLRLPDEPFELLLLQWNDPVGHGHHPVEPNHAGLFRAALGVDDTRAAHDALTAAGWAFDRPPVLVELRGTPVPDMWIAFLSDPDGVPFELVQRPRSAFRS